MRYCKLINDELIDVRFPIGETNHIFTNDPTILAQYGYKPVVYEETPELAKNEYVTPIYTETENAINVTWEVHETELDTNSDYIEAAKILLGEEEENAN